MGCPVIEWQMVAQDPERAATFYTGLFGWRIDANNALGYRRVDTGSRGGIDGGIWPSPPEGHNLVQLFVAVESVADYAKKAEGLGARTIVAPQRLPDGDELAIMVDPLGMPFGLMKRRT